MNNQLIVLLLGAGGSLSFFIGSTFMRLSEGVWKTWYAVGGFGFFLLGAIFNFIAFKYSKELGWVTALMLCGEVVLAFLLGIWKFGEDSSWPRFVGMAMILGGLVLLNK
jgi:drug/metabolite transporter (DMT)-like permease